MGAQPDGQEAAADNNAADNNAADNTDNNDNNDNNDRTQTVIDEVEKLCLDGPVYMIGRKKAVRLAELVREKKPRVVVECGTAMGYSGLWIARELKAAGRGKLITLEINPERVKQAGEHFRKAGVDDVITIKLGDARQLVKQIKGPVDFLFIDCGAPNYLPCLKGIQDRLAPGAVIVADNIDLSGSGLKDYLDEVRTKYKSSTEWFDVDLPWAKRDSMEISIVPSKHGD